MAGAVIGIACGGAGFFLLRKFCKAVCQEAQIPWALALANPAALLFGLGLAAWLCPGELACTGICMAVFLIAGAITEMVMARREKNKKAEGSRKRS